MDGRCPAFRATVAAMERSREDAVAEQCCCLAVSKESILWVAQERRDLGMGVTSAVLGHTEGIRGRQELAAQRGVKGDSPLSHGAAPCSSDPHVRDLRKETRLLLMILL